jgi:hypothetical protein
MGSTNVKTNKIEFITRILDTYTPTDISTTPYTLDEHGNIPSALSAAPAEEGDGEGEEEEAVEGDTIEAEEVGQGEEGKEEEKKEGKSGSAEGETGEKGRDAKRRKA